VLDGVVSVTPRPLYRDLVPTVEEAGWATGPVSMGVEKRKSYPSLAFEPLKPVASRYTYYVIPPLV